MSAPEGVRLAWVDTARGLGIVLVVLGHALIGLFDASLLPRSGWPWRLYYAVYAFHMPLFFWLAGLFAPRSLDRPAPALLTQWWWRLVWPYLLWSTLQWAVLGLSAGWANHAAELSLARWLALSWRPISQFWFLQTLLLLQVLAWWGRPRLGTTGLLWAALTLLLLPSLLPMPVGVTNVCRFGIFFVLGLVQAGEAPGADPALSAARAGPAATWLAVALLAGLVTVVSGEVMARGDLPWQPAALPAACAGVLGSVLLAQQAPPAAQALLARLGRASMPIFLLHIFFVAGTRIALQRLTDWSWAALLGLAVVAGLLGPLAVQAMARRLGGSRAWGLGT